jgi:hypothetical protein
MAYLYKRGYFPSLYPADMSNAALLTGVRDDNMYNMYLMVGNDVNVGNVGDDAEDAFEWICWEVAKQVAQVVGDVEGNEGGVLLNEFGEIVG